MGEYTNYVWVENDFLQGGRTVKSVKTFRPGDVVIRERALVACEVDRDSARLRGYLELSASQRKEFMQIFTDLELSQLGAPADNIDEAWCQDLIKEVNPGAALGIVTKMEVAAVLARWACMLHISKIRAFKVCSKLRHSCAGQVRLEYNLGTEMADVTASTHIAPQTRIGIWLLEDVTLWWKGGNVRTAEILKAGIFQSECRCERCEGPDVCRAVKCPGCSDGEVIRFGKEKRWKCNNCDLCGSDDAVAGLIDVERKLVEDLADMERIETGDLAQWLGTVSLRLGLMHWLAAKLWLEVYARHGGLGGEQDLTGTIASLNFIGWLASRKLPVPPKVLADEFVAMAFKALDFLQPMLLGVRDLRVLFLRAVEVVQGFLEWVDRRLLDRLKPYSGTAINIRRRCAFCRARLQEAREGGEDEALDVPEDGGVCEEPGPVSCSVCRDLSYCDLSCQVSDARRHRLACIPRADTLASPSVAQVVSLGRG